VDLPRGLLPQLMKAPHLKVLTLWCRNIPREDVHASIKTMSSEGGLQELEEFDVDVVRPISPAALSELEACFLHISALCPKLKESNIKVKFSES